MLKLKTLFFYYKSIFLLPHLLVLHLHPNKELILLDLVRWKEMYGINKKIILVFLYLMINYKEYRNLFYYRINNGLIIRFLNLFYQRLDSLYISTPKIGHGFFIMHGFSTILNSQSIGNNCIVFQKVTLGLNDWSDKGPIIQDNVRICTGAIIIGNIIIGKNSTIGAGALILKDVPDNCTVVGNPAYIIKRDGVKVNEKL
jgi:serine O-acetyltransferase